MGAGHAPFRLKTLQWLSPDEVLRNCAMYEVTWRVAGFRMDDDRTGYESLRIRCWNKWGGEFSDEQRVKDSTVYMKCDMNPPEEEAGREARYAAESEVAGRVTGSYEWWSKLDSMSCYSDIRGEAVWV